MTSKKQKFCPISHKPIPRRYVVAREVFKAMGASAVTKLVPNSVKGTLRGYVGLKHGA